MPVFLDRHDFFKVTAADIARIHLEELKIQEDYGCWVLAYWFDQKRKTTFCLIDAPDFESVKEMHCHLHHSYPRQIIQIEEDLIDYFLNSIESPKSLPKKYTHQSHFFQKPLFYAVMVMNLYCSNPFFTTEYIKRKMVFADLKDCFNKLVRKNNGRIVKSACDSCIYSFETISQSIKSALQIKNKLLVRKKWNDEKSTMLSIGIDGGKPMNEFCSHFEETINHARRLCYIAGINQIVVSSIIKEQLQLADLGIKMENDNLKSFSLKDEQFLTRLLDIIEMNYREDLKIKDVCKIMGESRSQLYRKIIDVTNLSPIALINEIRLKKATELMDMEKGDNISQIAFETGFNSLSYFSRRFKKRFGLHPSAYMNRSMQPGKVQKN